MTRLKLDLHRSRTDRVRALLLGCTAFTQVSSSIVADSLDTASTPRIREELLCEARERINDWYEAGKEALDLPRFRDGVTLRVTVSEMPCGGDKVPVTFGEYEVEGARPVDVFNVLTTQDPILGQIKSLGTFASEGAMGFEELYPSGMPMVASREFFQWYVYNASFAEEDFWFVYSTARNNKLHDRLATTQGAVASQNCLGAYRILPSAKGSHVVFTQHINPHPFLVAFKTVFDITWNKQVDFINTLRVNARKQAALGMQRDETHLPSKLLHDQPGIECSMRSPIGAPMLQIQLKSANRAVVTGNSESRWSSLQPRLLYLGLVSGLSLVFLCAAGHRVAVLVMRRSARTGFTELPDMERAGASMIQ